jgi:hypothetical protein
MNGDLTRVLCCRFGRYGEEGMLKTAENGIESIFLVLLHKYKKEGRLVVHTQGWDVLADIPGTINPHTTHAKLKQLTYSK